MPKRTDVAVITSCSLAGWDKYAKNCIPSLLQYWPSSVTLHLVSEDRLPLGNLPMLTKGRLTTWPLSSSLHYRAFHEKYMFDARARGNFHGYYRYIYDAWKFSKKVFAIDLVASNLTMGKLFWLDADVQTLRPIPENVLARFLPDEYHLSHLARPRMHSECGFVGYNLNYPDTFRFITEFARIYSSGEVFKLKEWHDSWVFDYIRNNKFSLLSYAIPHTNGAHPFNYSELGEYMDHWKGNRKNHQLSRDHPRFKQQRGNNARKQLRP